LFYLTNTIWLYIERFAFFIQKIFKILSYLKDSGIYVNHTVIVRDRTPVNGGTGDRIKIIAAWLSALQLCPEKINACPVLSTAIQKLGAGQDIDVILFSPAVPIWTELDQVAFLKSYAFAEVSTASQKLADEQDTVDIAAWLTWVSVDQFPFEYVYSVPSPSTATQNFGFAQETESKTLP
jgi:hypothetical protein